MRILIIRHGEPDYVHDSLTRKGRREAELLADRISALNIRDFYVSPLGRAQETAEPTLRRLGRTAETLPWLEEFRGMARDPQTQEPIFPWDLMPQLWTTYPELRDASRWRTNCMYSGEDVVRVLRETEEGLLALLARYGFRREGLVFRCGENRPETIALFCHFGIGMTMLSILLGLPLVPLWHGGMMPTTGVTTLLTEERVRGEIFFRCLQVGDTSHLYAAGEPLSRAGTFRECFDQTDWNDEEHP